MKSTLLATTALLALSASAFAADLPTRGSAPAPVPAMVQASWAGAYVGVIGGYGWGDGRFNGTDAATGANNKIKMNGAMVGAKVGYDFVTNGNIVLGAVADLSWTNLKGDVCVANRGCDPAVDAFAYGKMKWLGTVRARGGMAFGDTLVYATGGVAFSGLSSDLTHLVSPVTPTYTDRHTHVGWTIGAGVEHRLTKNVSVGAEYLYVDLGKEHYQYTTTPATFGANGGLKASIARASLNYRF